MPEPSLPWWVPLYVLVMLGGAIAGMFFERNRRPWGLVLLDVAITAAVLLFVLAYYAPGLIDHWSRANAPIYLATLIGVGVSHQWEARILPVLPTATHTQHQRLTFIGMLISLLLYAPGLGLGALVVLRTW